MKIENGKTYRVKGNSKYFKKKYGTSNPKIIIEARDAEVLGIGWEHADGNPAAMLYAGRIGSEGIQGDGPLFSKNVYYGKICGLGELVEESELEAMEEE